MLDPTSPPPLREELLALPPYQAVEPVAALAARLGLDPADVLKLDANENPFGALPAVRDAVAACDAFAVYPDPVQTRLRDALAAHLGLPAERIVAGAGSDELIELVIRALAHPGQRLLVCPPTFGMYRFVAGVQGIGLVEAARRPDFTLDLDAVLAALTDDVPLVVLASPNNPTGNALSDAELAALLATGATVVVDEAYAEFAGRSFVPWTERHPRLIVLRTFSKWAGLAGLRVGYGVFPAPVAELLLRIKQPYNVNVAAEAAALAALRHAADFDPQRRALVDTRDALAARLAELDWLRVFPSDANFLLCEIAGDKGADFHQALAARGVLVRYFTSPERLRSCIRISVPHPDRLNDLCERLQDAAHDCGLS